MFEQGVTPEVGMKYLDGSGNECKAFALFDGNVFGHLFEHPPLNEQLPWSFTKACECKPLPDSEPDWAKIFTVDKPFMVRDCENSEWKLGFAMAYLKMAKHPFYCFGGGASANCAKYSDQFKHCRKLTPEELEQYGFAADVYSE